MKISVNNFYDEALKIFTVKIILQQSFLRFIKQITIPYFLFNKKPREERDRITGRWWNVRRNDDHQSDVRVASRRFIPALVLALFINTPTPGKSAISLLISPRQIIHFSRRKRSQGERKEGKSFEHYVTSISQTLVSITSPWPWLNFTYHPKTYRSITR